MISHVYKIHGIVLKRRNIGEADRIISLFTEEYGKIRVVAKGIRRISSRRAAHLEVFRLVTATIHRGKVMDSMTEVASIALVSQSPIQKVNFSYYVCELIDRLLPEHQKHTDVFDRAIDAFASINAGVDQDDWQGEVYRFASELLWCLGFLPRATTLREDRVQTYIERIIERKLRTPGILTKLASKE